MQLLRIAKINSQGKEKKGPDLLKQFKTVLHKIKLLPKFCAKGTNAIF